MQPNISKPPIKKSALSMRHKVVSLSGIFPRLNKDAVNKKDVPLIYVVKVMNKSKTCAGLMVYCNRLLFDGATYWLLVKYLAKAYEDVNYLPNNFEPLSGVMNMRNVSLPKLNGAYFLFSFKSSEYEEFKRRRRQIIEQHKLAIITFNNTNANNGDMY